MHRLGKINLALYRCVTQDIVSDQLIITEKQLEHILARHPNDFSSPEDIFICIKKSVSSPDFIIESDKPNTAFILKEIQIDRRKLRLIMRLKTSGDPVAYENSIITFQKIREKEWIRILRNKKILYKSE